MKFSEGYSKTARWHIKAATKTLNKLYGMSGGGLPRREYHCTKDVYRLQQKRVVARLDAWERNLQKFELMNGAN